MLPAARALLAELDAEASITRRVFERVPADRFDWQPHPKSMSAGQLAHHIAGIPAIVASIVALDGLDLAARTIEYPRSEGPAALLARLDASVAAARDALTNLTEDKAAGIWRLTFGPREVFAQPRLAVIRVMGFNHLYHHRGELVVYLRLLGLPVPIVYGQSADESPFAAPAA